MSQDSNWLRPWVHHLRSFDRHIHKVDMRGRSAYSQCDSPQSLTETSVALIWKRNGIGTFVPPSGPHQGRGDCGE